VIGFVLDASAGGTLCFEDEDRSMAQVVLSLMDERPPVHVPAAWFVEMGNVLWVAERRGRLTSEEVDQAVSFLHSLPLVVDTDYRSGLWAARRLGRQFDIAIYDALYLELAIRMGLPLATVDRKQAAAAKSAGVSLIAHASRE